MTNLRRIIEVDLEVAKSIKGGDNAACNCNCNALCYCGSESFSGTDARLNRQKYTLNTNSSFK